MKIVFFVYRYWPDVGGVEKYIHRLAKAVQGMGHEARVIVPAHRAGLPSREFHDGIEVIRFPGYRSPARAWFHLMRLQWVFCRADVIHVSNTHMLEYFYRMVAWTLPNRPLFLTRHGMSYIYPVPESEKARARRSIDLVDGVVHDGCFIGTRLGVKADCVPNQGLHPEADALPVIPEPAPTSATFVGRLEPDSGIEIYVDAIDVLIRDFGLSIALDVYGGGTLEDALRNRAARDGLPVTFHGWQEGAQERITEGCFALVAGRLAMQEAMARRRLVVAAYVDPLKRDYVCGEPFSPYLVSGGDARTIAAQVAHYATHHDERKRMVEQAYAYARTLSWRRTAAAYVDLWTHPPRGRRQPLSRLQRARLAVQLRREAYGKACSEPRSLARPLPAS